MDRVSEFSICNPRERRGSGRATYPFVRTRLDARGFDAGSRQNGGRGTVWPAKRARWRGTPLRMFPRLQRFALSRGPCAELASARTPAKYASDSSLGSRVTVPRCESVLRASASESRAPHTGWRRARALCGCCSLCGRRILARRRRVAAPSGPMAGLRVRRRQRDRGRIDASRFASLDCRSELGDGIGAGPPELTVSFRLHYPAISTVRPTCAHGPRVQWPLDD